MFSKIMFFSFCCFLGISSLSYATKNDEDDKKTRPSTQPQSQPQTQPSGRTGDNDQKGGDQKGQTNVNLNKNKDCSIQ